MADSDYKVLRTREERLAFARSMNMFSTPFMREVFKDEKATQYVLRMLTGKKDLKVQQNLTEYRISKLDTRDAVLDVIAVDDKGVFYHIELQLVISAESDFIQPWWTVNFLRREQGIKIFRTHTYSTLA